MPYYEKNPEKMSKKDRNGQLLKKSSQVAHRKKISYRPEIESHDMGPHAYASYQMSRECE